MKRDHDIKVVARNYSTKYQVILLKSVIIHHMSEMVITLAYPPFVTLGSNYLFSMQ